MLANEVRPGRNHREMHRLSQWRIASFSGREKTSESSATRSMTDQEASSVSSSMNCPSIIASRKDSPAFDKTFFRDDIANNDSQNDDSSSSLTMKIIIDSSTNANNVEARKYNDNKREKESRCKCKNLSDRHIDLSYFNDKYRYIRNFSTKKCENHDGDNVRWTMCEMRKFFPCKRSWQAVVSLILIALVSVCSGELNQCAVGITTPGRTWPHGDIVLEYGQPLKILCMLNQTYIDDEFPDKNSSDLVFFHNKREIEPEYIKIVNETTIAMYVEKPPPAEDTYYCKLKLDDRYNKQYEPVCLNNVVIGFKPQEPENFTCVSYNWENLTCSWKPVPNYVTTEFTIAFKLLGRPGGRKLYPCPKDTEKVLPPNSCFWDTYTNPIYRQPHEYYTFILNVSNVFGVLSIPYKFHHYAHVIPAKPANLSVVNKTSDSTLLHWNVLFPMQNFPPGLHHRVTYQHQWDNRKTWRVINITTDIHTPNRYFNLSGLEYANTKYDVRVFMKSALAIGEDKWSQFSDVTFRTPPRLPGLPPRTEIGSFEIVENNANRDVFLYWQAIPSYLENGDNFKYQVSHIEENGRKLDLQPSEITRTYAKFKGISFNNFRFEIATTNIVGANKQTAKISVPSRLEMVHEPLVFTKIAFDGGLYELSWKPPPMNKDITNYTIFWCNSDRDRPYPCSGYLDWVTVPKTTMIYNVTVPKPKNVYQFAISANTERSSSGMVWALCTVIHNRVVGKMKSVWINHIGSDYIKIGWKLECSDRIGVVEGFNIYYCPIVSPYNLNCKGQALNKTIRDDNMPIDGTVRGLKPYTTYKFTVAVLTKNGEGLHSDPQTHTTLEAAPSTPPMDVNVTDVTNSSMIVSWNPPAAMNGVLRYYEIQYNGKPQKIEEVQHVVLKNLSAHTNYSISVAACTVKCSVQSPPIYRLTAIGKPGSISGPPLVKFKNATQVEVSWAAPQNAGGLLDYYQIWSADGEIYNSSTTGSRLPIADCGIVGTDRLYEFRVRAINIAPNGEHHEGPWSDTGSGSCYSHGPSPLVCVIIWIISCLSGLAFLLCLAYTSKRMWLKCKAMQDVEVKLPPGLAPNMKLLQKVGEQHIRQSSADSSGCSSGQESVTSSLTSDSHVSSDSGADVDPIGNPPVNKLLDTAPSWEASSLRQRNVGTARPVGAAANESPRWESYVKVAKTGEPVLDDTLSLARSTPNLTDSTGYAVSPHAWSSTGYISMPSSEDLSSNPSPISKETINPSNSAVVLGGGYSVVGVVPKPILRTKNDDRTSEMGNTLIPCKTNETKPAMPYVSLVSLEEKFKEKSQPAIDALGDIDDMDFIEANIDNRESHGIVDNPSKPYVKTGLLDTMKKPLSAISTIEKKVDPSMSAPYISAATFGDSVANKPFATTFSRPRTMKPSNTDTTTLSSKPYVAVGWMADLTSKSSSPATLTSSSSEIPQKKSLASGNTESTSDKPYVTAATAFRASEKGDNKGPPSSSSLSMMHDIDDKDENQASSCSMWQNETDDDEINTTTDDCGKSVVTNKQAPSYVTVGENSKHEQQHQKQQQQQLSTNSPYVQHSIFEKQLSQQPRSPAASTATSMTTTTPTSTSTTTTDERYSKVSIAPNMLQ